MTETVGRVLDEAADALDRVRTRAPRVHSLTSPVAAERTANTLLAIGARPTLSDTAETIDAFVDAAGAVCINLGQLTPQRIDASRRAAQRIKTTATPWVLDPVHCETSPARAAFANELLALGPSVLRANAAEDALLTAAASVRLVTGETDTLRAGSRELVVTGGHPWLDRVTAVGCAQGAMIAAFLAVDASPIAAAVAASVAMKRAGERAGGVAAGPGTFAAALLDALHALAPRDMTTAPVTDRQRA